MAGVSKPTSEWRCPPAASAGRSCASRPANSWLYQWKNCWQKAPAVLDAAEAIRKLRAVLHGAELAFRIRIVVEDVRPAVRLGDAQIGHQKGHRLGGHDFAAVGMDGELAGRTWCLPIVFFDELLGQFRASRAPPSSRRRNG